MHAPFFVLDIRLGSRPPCQQTVPSIFQFALKHGGGCKGDFIMETENFVRVHGKSNRVLGEIWSALCLEVKGTDQLTRWRHMLLKLAYAGPEKALTVTDVAR